MNLYGSYCFQGGILVYGHEFRADFEALYKRNKKYFYYPFFYHLYIDILRLHKKLIKKENSKFTKL